MMRKLATFFLTVAAVSCTQPDDAERKAVEQVVHDILKADNQADIEVVLSFYDDNAVLLPAGRPEIKGKPAIRVNYQTIFEISALNLFPEIESIEVSGSLAVCKGRTKGDVQSKRDSTKTVVDDKFLMVLRKDMSWKITHLMWSKDH